MAQTRKRKSAKVISLDAERARRGIERPRRFVKAPHEPWKFQHLNGQRPEGHTEVRYGPRGKVLLTPGNVWVEIGLNELWVVKRFELRRKSGSYRHQIWLARYRSHSRELRELSESTLHGSMMVWNEYGPWLESLVQQGLQ